jgi:hypothetical protein
MGVSLGAVVLVLAGCAGLPLHVHKTRSVALANPATTQLGEIVAAEDANPNLSGVRLLTSGDEALASLIALADHAERTLDLQCCITCGSPPIAASGFACWSMTSTRPARTGASCI